MLNCKKVLNISAQSRRNQRVSKRRVFLAIFLLALWLPATSHALLEDFGFIHQEVAHASGHDGADGLCLIEWADRVADQLPLDAWIVQLETIDTTARRVILTGGGSAGPAGTGKALQTSASVSVQVVRISVHPPRPPAS